METLEREVCYLQNHIKVYQHHGLTVELVALHHRIQVLRLRIDEMKRERRELEITRVLAMPIKVPLVMRRVFEFIHG